MNKALLFLFVLAGGCMVGEDTPDDPSDQPEDPTDDGGAGGVIDVDAFATGNLLENGGFEQGLIGWSYGSEGTGSYVHATKYARYSGSLGARLKSASGIAPSAAIEEWVEAQPGRSYTITAITRRREVGDQGDQQNMLVRIKDATFHDLHVHVVQSGYSTSWHKLTMTVTAPPNAKWLALDIGDLRIVGVDMPDHYGSTHDWDNVRVVAN